jgi:regulator of sigma E protease
MLSWLAWIPVLGIVIFIHELGHFLAAKWAGVYAPRFSLGWGSPLWSFRRGETEYALSWLPIGGYVRMASKEDETASSLEGGGEGEGVERSKHWDEHSMIPHGPKPIPADRWFESKSLFKRLVIMLAGVTMNVLLALVVNIGVVATAGREYMPAVADSIIAGRPAATAGLQRGDTIIRIDGRPIRTAEQMLALVSDAAGREVEMHVKRGVDTVVLRVTPEAQRVARADGDSVSAGRIGIGLSRVSAFDPFDARKAVGQGWSTTWQMGGEVLRVLKGLVSGNVNFSELGGPIQIARSSVEVAQAGLAQLWIFVAFLSVNLAILNLLPIPLLDGGQILIQVAESGWRAMGRQAFSPMVREWYARVGLVAILLIFLTVTFNDLRRWITGLLSG